MTIEFLVDTMKEEEQDKLKKILEVLKKQPKANVKKEAVFLRKFILACMGQYYRNEKLNPVQEKRAVVQEIRTVKMPMPAPPRMISLESPAEEAPRPVRIIPEAPYRI